MCDIFLLCRKASNFELFGHVVGALVQVKSLDRDVAEGGVESVRIDVRVRDCGGEASEQIDECKRGA